MTSIFSMVTLKSLERSLIIVPKLFSFLSFQAQNANCSLANLTLCVHNVVLDAQKLLYASVSLYIFFQKRSKNQFLMSCIFLYVLSSE